MTNVRELQKVLDLLSGLIDIHRPSLPAMACVLLQTGQVIANNLEQICVASLPSLVLNKAIGVNLRVLKKVLKSCKGDINLTVRDDDFLEIDDSSVVAGIPAADMPTQDREIGDEKTPNFLVPLELAAIATGSVPVKQDGHDNLKGVCFHFQHREIVASNGHFLLKARLDVEAQDFEAIVPTQAIDLLKKLKTPILGQFYVREQPSPNSKNTEPVLTTHAIFQNEHVTLLTNCPDLQFPDYLQVIPKQPPLSLTFNRDAAQAALKSCAHIEELKFVTMKLDTHSMQINASHWGMSVNKLIVAEMVTDEANMPIILRLNYEYFKKVLDTQPDRVTFHLYPNDKEKGFVTHPITFPDAVINGVIMPAAIL